MTARLPSPNACQHCNIDLPHGWQYTPDAGLHQWEQPTQTQIKARMRARRFARNSALPTQYHAATAEFTEWNYACDTPDTTEYCADCGDAECPRWSRIQDRLEQQSFDRMMARHNARKDPS
ncbi:hypothetical protein ACFW9I_03180 [[Kitasatospora] papulosa]|uniref:hypothetical protein n=1 Tax=[Kitasatospora] papulosa TaxID=1464011 RepID=UPI0036BE23B7